jgi:hypothetical protein
VIESSHNELGYDIFRSQPPSSFISKPVKKRPQRVVIENAQNFSGRGFYDGKFIHHGYDASINLKRHKFIYNESDKDNALLYKFFELGGCALNFDSNINELNATQFLKDSSKNVLGLKCSNSPIQQLSYSSEKIIYDVNLNKDSIIIENEIGWPGWRGFSNSSPNANIFYPLENFYPYRAWRLSKGTYQFSVFFHDSFFYFSLIASYFNFLFFSILLFIHRYYYYK